LGQTVNSKGDSLGATRFAGWKDEADAQVLKFMHQDPAAIEWEDVKVKYSKPDGTFDKSVATRLKVGDLIHASRAQGAEDARAKVSQLHPTPPLLPEERHTDWQKRTNTLHNIVPYVTICLNGNTEYCRPFNTGCAREFNEFVGKFDKEANKLGCKGFSVFSQLPYFEYASSTLIAYACSRRQAHAEIKCLSDSIIMWHSLVKWTSQQAAIIVCRIFGSMD
jgi:hypothetical protein